MKLQVWLLPAIATPSRRYLKGSANPDIPNLSSGLEVSKSQGTFEWSSTSFIISYSDFDTIHIFMIRHICHLVKKWPVRSYRLPDFKNVSVFLFSCCAALTLASSQTLTKLLTHLPLPSRTGERTRRAKMRNLLGQGKGSLIGEGMRQKINSQKVLNEAREITHHLPPAGWCKASQRAMVMFLANKKKPFVLPLRLIFLMNTMLCGRISCYCPASWRHSRPNLRNFSHKFEEADQEMENDLMPCKCCQPVYWYAINIVLTTNPKHSTVWAQFFIELSHGRKLTSSLPDLVYFATANCTYSDSFEERFTWLFLYIQMQKCILSGFTATVS